MPEVNQVCYATADIEATARAMAEIDGIGPFFMGQFPLSGLNYRGAAIQYDPIKVAFAYNGSLQIELIEAPIGMPSCYAEVLDGRREALHHVYVSSDEGYDAIIARHARAGEPLAYSGLAGEGIRFGFVDARARLGHFVEVLESERMVGPDAAIYDLYERIKQASQAWDGSRPLREMAEML
jgi:hypothetical protein